MNTQEFERRAAASVAAGHGDRDALKRLGSGSAELQCPECGARGARFGNPGEEMRFQGFLPKSTGGLSALLARCEGCSSEVVLPHRRA